MIEPNEKTRAELDEDMTYAISALVGAEGGELRRMLRLALATLYAWENFRKRTTGQRLKDAGDAGRIAADLIAIRGFAVHTFIRTPGVIAIDALPADDQIPANDRLPPLEPWFDADAGVDFEGNPVAAAAFERLRGQRIVPLLEDAVVYMRSA